MRITLGLNVADWQGPSAAPRLAEPLLGRAAFLALLELHLGLAGPEPTKARRVAAYLGCLRKVDHDQRFFHGSLAVDEVGTAAQLLSWRDEWKLGGWDGKALESWPARLADMAAVEAHAQADVPAGEAERLAAVATRLTARKVPVASVQLLDSLESFPWAWRQVLGLLPCNAPPPAGNGAGVLGELQRAALRALSSQAVVPVPEPANSDDSIQIFESKSSASAQYWFGARCRADAVTSRLLVCESGGAALDDTFRVSGTAACGFDEPSRLRPALQALGLAFETLWEPLDPHRTLEFLMHPIGPFRRSARRGLARAFADQPGIGGSRWATAREKIATTMDKEVLDQVQFWMEGQRWTREAGAPVAAVVERAQRLARSLQGLIARSPEQSRDLGAALPQIASVLEALHEIQSQGEAAVRPRLLEQLILQATGRTSNSQAVAEVGCFQSATSAGACGAEPADEVVWWMPSTPRLPSPLPWIPEEIDALAAAGVALRDPASQLANLAVEWLQPLLAARVRFSLVLPPPGQEEHPTWQLLQRLAPWLKARSVEAEAQSDTVGRLLPLQPLPPLKPQWAMAGGNWAQAFPAPTRKQHQSYTSLNELFNQPAIAVLKDPAQLEVGTSLAFGNTARLLGTLAHRMVEKLFGEDGAIAWPETQLHDWFDGAVEDLIHKEGAPLRALGAGMQLHAFKRITLNGMLALLRHLREMGALEVEPERALSGTLNGLAVVGKADLIAHLGEGRTVALDLKWAGSKRYRSMLADGDFLQLALYAEMIDQQFKAPPVALGYFTFLDGALVALPNDVTGPSAIVITPADGITPAQLIQQASHSWKWRSEQWQHGVIDVLDERVVNLKAVQVPADCLVYRKPGPWNGDFEVLLGVQE